MRFSALARWGILGIVVIAVSAALGFYVHTPSEVDLVPARAQQSAEAPTIGGPFTLVNHDGETVTDQDYSGRFMLVYFGFTYCPDVCPTSLTAIAEALDMLGKHAGKIAPLFVTVDPERDTPEQMKMYVEHFHPNLVGLTGTLDQIETPQWDPRPAVCVVMASEGYPGSYDKGHEIRGLAEADAVPDVKVFHAGTKEVDGKVVTAGGRVLRPRPHRRRPRSRQRPTPLRRRQPAPDRPGRCRRRPRAGPGPGSNLCHQRPGGSA